MKENQKKLSFTKEKIAALNSNTLSKILGGSEVDTSETSELYSDGPPHTSFAASEGPPESTLNFSRGPVTTLGLSG